MVSQIDSQIVAREVLANEIHYLQGKVYLGGHNTKIKIMDVHKKLSCTALKNKQDCVDGCKELKSNTQGSLTALKYRLMCHLKKKLQNMKQKTFKN